jgi:hypothetical protein
MLDAGFWMLDNSCILSFFVGVQRVQGFKVPFSSLDCIWDAYFREKRQLRQVYSKI